MAILEILREFLFVPDLFIESSLVLVISMIWLLGLLGLLIISVCLPLSPFILEFDVYIPSFILLSSGFMIWYKRYYQHKGTIFSGKSSDMFKPSIQISPFLSSSEEEEEEEVAALREYSAHHSGEYAMKGLETHLKYGKKHSDMIVTHHTSNISRIKPSTPSLPLQLSSNSLNSMLQETTTPRDTEGGREINEQQYKGKNEHEHEHEHEHVHENKETSMSIEMGVSTSTMTCLPSRMPSSISSEKTSLLRKRSISNDNPSISSSIFPLPNPYPPGSFDAHTHFTNSVLLRDIGLMCVCLSFFCLSFFCLSDLLYSCTWVHIAYSFSYL